MPLMNTHPLSEARAGRAGAEPTTLRDIWQESSATVQDELALIEGAVLAAGEGRLGPEQRAETRRCLHRLGGAMAMFGFVRASSTAGVLYREFAFEGEPPAMRSLLTRLRLDLSEETGSKCITAGVGR